MTTEDLIYLDNHATTRCDDRVVEAMLPLLLENYGNVHSTSHAFGRAAAAAYDEALDSLAASLGCVPDELVITSGATEANNLALIGFCTHPRQRRRHVITVGTEHPSVLDPVARLEAAGFRITRLPVIAQGGREAGRIDLDALTAAIDDDTAIVSVMAAQNEIGVLQPLPEIAEVCHRHGAVLHSDAAQALGRVAVDVDHLGVDLLSGSAHKFYAPKGVGLLYVRRRERRVRLRPLIDGGGQQGGLRSGTLNTAGAVAMAVALRLAVDAIPDETVRLARLADRLWLRLSEHIAGLRINGPATTEGLRLPGNLNLCFPDVEGEALMAAAETVAVSSGSACSSVDPRPSHVLLELGLSESEARRSVRFGIGRFNTEQQIDRAADALADAHQRLRSRYA